MKLEYVDINNIPEKKNRVKYGALSKLIKNFLDSGKAAAKVDYTDLYRTELCGFSRYNTSPFRQPSICNYTE